MNSHPSLSLAEMIAQREALDRQIHEIKQKRHTALDRITQVVISYGLSVDDIRNHLIENGHNPDGISLSGKEISTSADDKKDSPDPVVAPDASVAAKKTAKKASKTAPKGAVKKAAKKTSPTSSNPKESDSSAPTNDAQPAKRTRDEVISSIVQSPPLVSDIPMASTPAFEKPSGDSDVALANPKLSSVQTKAAPSDQPEQAVPAKAESSPQVKDESKKNDDSLKRAAMSNTSLSASIPVGAKVSNQDPRLPSAFEPSKVPGKLKLRNSEPYKPKQDRNPLRPSGNRRRVIVEKPENPFRDDFPSAKNKKFSYDF